MNIAAWGAILLGLFILNGCEDSKGLAARVDHAPITVAEVDLLMARRGLSPESATAEQRTKAEDELIDQTLYVQKARELALDQEAGYKLASRELLARAYLARLQSQIANPGEDEVLAYYDLHPELFRDRRRYKLQEIAVQADSETLVAVEKQFDAMRTFNEMVRWLKNGNIPYTVGATFKSSDRLPGDILPHLVSAREGQVVKVRIPGGMAALQVVKIDPDPVALADAREDIQKFLRNRRMESLLKESARELRANAKIERYANSE